VRAGAASSLYSTGLETRTRRLLTLPERHPYRVVLVIGLLFALAYGASLVALRKPNGQIVLGDALAHYVQLRSMVFDRDLQFRNEYLRMYGVEEGSALDEAIAIEHGTPTGHLRNYMPVGPALLWAPLFLLVTAGVWVANLFGAGYPLDGYARAFQSAAGFSGVVAAACGTCFAFAAASQIATRRAAIWAALAVWLASSTIYYSVISPTYSHAASMLAVSAFWWAWVRSIDRQSLGRYALLGALVGVSALMRWQDAILVVVPLLDAAWHWRTARPAGAVARAATAILTAAIAFLPQIGVWMVLYARPFVIPQGSGFMRWDAPALMAVLFSDHHGLLTWTPVIAPALAGLVPLARRSRLVALGAIVFLVLSWYVNAAVADWWAGEAFGARRFISCYPVFVIALAALFDRWRDSPARLALVSGAFVLYTFLLLVQYQAFMHGLRAVVPYPRGFVDLWLWRFRVPFDLLRWLLQR